jgi:hypothetical protein
MTSHIIEFARAAAIPAAGAYSAKVDTGFATGIRASYSSY